jgi:hypothetical protein
MVRIERVDRDRRLGLIAAELRDVDVGRDGRGSSGRGPGQLRGEQRDRDG